MSFDPNYQKAGDTWSAQDWDDLFSAIEEVLGQGGEGQGLRNCDILPGMPNDVLDNSRSRAHIRYNGHYGTEADPTLDTFPVSTTICEVDGTIREVCYWLGSKNLFYAIAVNGTYKIVRQAQDDPVFMFIDTGFDIEVKEGDFIDFFIGSWSDWHPAEGDRYTVMIPSSAAILDVWIEPKE